MEAQFNTHKLARFIAGFKDRVCFFRRLVTRFECGRDAYRRPPKRKTRVQPHSYAKAAHPPRRAVEPSEPPLFRDAPLTLRTLTAYWIDELLASNERIRRAAAEVEGFMEVLDLAHSYQALSEDDAQLVLIVEKLLAVLSHAFAVERRLQSNV